MRKLTFILMVSVVTVFAGLLAWNAEATAMSGLGGGAAKACTPVVQDIGCRRNAPLIGENGCRRGTHQVCKKKTGCLCVPC